MTQDTDDIYVLKPPPALPRRQFAQPPALMAPLGGALPVDNAKVEVARTWRQRAREISAWLIIALLLTAGGLWAFRAGMNLRHDLWTHTRSVRFHGDIWNGFRWGNAVLRSAEASASLPPLSDALANQSPETMAKLNNQQRLMLGTPSVRRLTLHEVFTGIVQFYDDREAQSVQQDLQLDYPPLRLMMMTLWVRHVQREHPQLVSWPWPQPARDTPESQIEDIAQPLLNFNAASSGAAAIAMFFMVWLWTARGQSAAAKRRAARLVPHGMLAFLVATVAFWWAFVALASPPARPSPVVRVTRVASDIDSITVSGVVNAQDSPTRWHVEWGPDLTYSQTTPPHTAQTGLADTAITTTLRPVAPGDTIHLRLSAVNPAGVSHTEDVEFRAGSAAVDLDLPAVGGIAWYGWTVWIRLLLLFVIMVLCARRLPAPHRGWALGAVAAALVWFDPANLVTSHAWPQWDVWILPVFIGAGLLASLDCWLSAGLVLGAGCMLKGQLLLGMPVLLLWPLFGGRWSAFLRIISGLALGAGFVVWPWIIGAGAARWILRAAIAAMLVGALALMRPMVSWPRRIYALAALGVVTVGLALIFAYLHPSTGVGTVPLLCFALAALAVPFLLPRRQIGYWLIAMFTASLWIAALQFNGDFSWLQVGFAYGTVKFPFMAMGNGDFSNLMAVLATRYHWDLYDTVGSVRFAFSTPGALHAGSFVLPRLSYENVLPLEIKTCMTLVYAATVILCAIAAAVHSKRRDPRVLAALAAPWILFPLLMGQMSERYLLWGSGATAAFVAVSMGSTLLHVLLALLGAGMTGSQLLGFDSQRWPEMSALFRRAYPSCGWMLTLLALMFLATAIAPSRRGGFWPTWTLKWPRASSSKGAA